MNTTYITCPVCHGEGVINNPPTFYSAGETPELSINCETCKGTGEVELSNPIGTRIAVLVAKRIIEQHQHLQQWEPIYRAIVVNISGAVNSAISTAIRRSIHVPDPIFALDEVFSDDTLAIDAFLNAMIDRRPYFMDEARLLLGLDEKS